MSPLEIIAVIGGFAGTIICILAVVTELARIKSSRQKPFVFLIQKTGDWRESHQAARATNDGEVKYGQGKYAIRICQDPYAELRKIDPGKAVVYYPAAPGI